VLGTGLAQLRAQLRELGDGQPAVLGQDGGGGALEALAHLLHHRDLLWACHRLHSWALGNEKPPEDRAARAQRPPEAVRHRLRRWVTRTRYADTPHQRSSAPARLGAHRALVNATPGRARRWCLPPTVQTWVSADIRPSSHANR